MARQMWEEALLLLTVLESFAEAGKRLPGSIEIANLLAIGWQSREKQAKPWKPWAGIYGGGQNRRRGAQGAFHRSTRGN